MGKFLVGCLVVFALLVVGGGTAGYLFFIKPGLEYASEFARMGEEFEALNDDIVNTGDFSPPNDATVGEAQFRRFLAAQRQMRTRLEGRLEELDAKYEAMKSESGQQEMGIKDMIDAHKDLLDLILEAKRAQVEALNAQGFSLAEYAWVRNCVYRAIGQSVAVAAMAETSPDTMPAEIDTATVEMVTPHREELMEMHALAWFGL